MAHEPTLRVGRVLDEEFLVARGIVDPRTRGSVAREDGVAVICGTGDDGNGSVGTVEIDLVDIGIGGAFGRTLAGID